jgi:hypothetical protein
MERGHVAVTVDGLDETLARLKRAARDSAS